MDDEHLTINEVAEQLGVHYMTAYRYVRLGVLPARKVGSTWQIRRADVAKLEASSLAAAARPLADDGSGAAAGSADREDGSPDRLRQRGRRGSRRAHWAKRLEARLLAGDGAGSWAVLEAAQASGASVTDVYLHIVSPAMRAIGDRWEAGDVDVADEHQASAIASRVLGRLAPRLASPGRPRRSVVVGGVAGDHHSLAVTMAADLLTSARHHVIDLGADVPPASFVHAARGAPRLGMVAVTVTTGGLEDAVVELVSTLHDALPGIPVAVGGNATPDEAAAFALGADLWAPDALALANAIEPNHPDG